MIKEHELSKNTKLKENRTVEIDDIKYKISNKCDMKQKLNLLLSRAYHWITI